MELKVRFVGAIELVLSWLVWPMYMVLSLRPKNPIPSLKSPLSKKSATNLAKAIRQGEVKCSEVIEVYINRIKEVNPHLNAVVEDRFEAARSEAKAVDALIASRSKSNAEMEKETPLLGVPFTVKESCGLKGLSQSGGCLPRKGAKAEIDGFSVCQLKKAGGIPLCVTNTPELCLFWESNNLVTGCTNNPFDLHRTPGGSSGGEGALLGSGASLIGVGSDLAGSIRIPSMFNGVFGHKPTPECISSEGHYPWTDSLKKCLVVGPMARYSEDLPLLMKVMTGDNGKMLNLDKEVDVSKLNIFYMDEAGKSLVAVQVSSEVKKSIIKGVKYLSEKHNCCVKQDKFEDLVDSVEISSSVLLDLEDIPDLFDLSTKKDKEEMNIYSELAKSLVHQSEFSTAGIMFMMLVKHKLFIPDEKIKHYKQLNENLKQLFIDKLGDNGVFIYPTFPIPAVYHNEIYTRTAGVMYTMIFNTLEMPSTHVPMGLSENGLPIGFQVVAAPFQDRLCLAVAKALEDGFGGWVCPPTAS